MKRTLRILGATLLLSMAVPLVQPAEPASALPVPDGNCDMSTPYLTLVTCSDEAGSIGVTVAQFIKWGDPTAMILWDLLYADPGSADTYEECMGQPAPLGNYQACAPLFGDAIPDDGEGLYDTFTDLLGVFDPDELAFLCLVFPSMPACEGFGVNEEWWSSTGLEPVAAGALGAEMFRTDLVAVGTPPPYATIFTGPFLESAFGDGNAHPILKQERGSGTTLYLEVRARYVPSTDLIEVWMVTNGTSFGTSTTVSIPLGEWGDLLAVGVVNPGGTGATSWLRIASPDDLGDPTSFVGSNGAASGWKQMEAFVNTDLYGSIVTAAAGWVGMTWQGTGVTPTQTQMTTMLGDLPAIFPGNPGEVEEPEPIYPEIPSYDDIPVSPPDPTPAPAPVEVPEPTPTPNEEVTEGEGDQGLFDQLANRMAGMFDGLGSLIGSSFGWLGDLLTDLFGWLVDRLWQMFRWLFDQLRELLEWLGSLLQWLGQILDLIYRAVQSLALQMGTWFQALINVLGDLFGALSSLLLDALGALGDLLVGVIEAIIALPSAILDGLASILTDLFVPSGAVVDLQECDTSFPCSWVQEIVAAFSGLGDTLDGAGGCVAPSLGWTEFRVSFPPPSGCSAAAGSLPAVGADDAGDLFGYRAGLRAAVLIAFGLAFIYWVLSLTPWGDKFGTHDVSPTRESVMG